MLERVLWDFNEACQPNFEIQPHLNITKIPAQNLILSSSIKNDFLHEVNWLSVVNYISKFIWSYKGTDNVFSIYKKWIMDWNLNSKKIKIRKPTLILHLSVEWFDSPGTLLFFHSSRNWWYLCDCSRYETD